MSDDGKNVNEVKKTPAQILNEIMMKRAIVPQYELIKDDGEAGVFMYRVHCQNQSAVGSASTKKDAKQIAAQSMLSQISQNEKDSDAGVDTEQRGNSWFMTNSVGILQILCSRDKLPRPVYEVVEAVGPPHARLFTIECTALTFKTRGTAQLKRMAKHEAARGMISILSEARETIRILLGKMENLNSDELNGDFEQSEQPTETTGELKRRKDKLKRNVIFNKTTESSTVAEASVKELTEPATAAEPPLDEITENLSKIKIAEVADPETIKKCNLKYPTGCLVFQRKYVARKLNEFHRSIVNTSEERTHQFVAEIWKQFKRILALIDVQPEQIILPTHDDKYMLAVYLPTEPQIVDIAVEDNEVQLRVSVYRRLVEKLLLIL